MDVVVVMQADLVDLAAEIRTPVAAVESKDSQPESFPQRVKSVKIAEHEVHIFQPEECTESILLKFIDSVPLTEPFERIELAIKEAHSVAA